MNNSNSVVALVLFFTLQFSSAQDCYHPPSGSILYSSLSESYSHPIVTGLVTQSEYLSGDWKILSTSGNVEASLLDHSGRTSTLQLSGQGKVVIENVQTDLSQESNNVSQCVQEFTVKDFQSAAKINPDLRSFCPVKVVVVIDESASIVKSNIDNSIRRGVMTFANLLSNSGSEMSVVEYDSKARHVEINGISELQLVNSIFLEGLDDYLKNGYKPTSDEFKLIGGTNWQDALQYADKIDDADFILMLTDGNPTFYNVGDHVMGAVAGEGEKFDLTALKFAQNAANKIKGSDKHLFVVGVDIPNSNQAIVDISGGDEFQLGGDVSSFLSADYISVNSDQIEQVFGKIGIETCGTRIPTIGEWGIVNLSLILLILGIVAIKNVPINELNYDR